VRIYSVPHVMTKSSTPAYRCNWLAKNAKNNGFVTI
jgi:hypothetical protein